MTQNFLRAAQQGKNQWWRYLLGISLTLFFFVVLGAVVAIVLYLRYSDVPYEAILLPALGEENWKKFLTTPSIASYLATNAGFVLGIAALFLTVRGIHQRKFASLVRSNSEIQWRRVFLGALVWMLIMGGFTAIDYLVSPKNYVWSFTSLWWVMLPMALVITPMQTSFEELLFRGYLMQGMALLLKNKFVLVILNGLLFMSVHLENPEMQRGGILALSYFIVGAALAAIAIRDHGLELPLGIHAANNLQVLFFNTKDSALPYPSLWQIQTPANPALDIIATCLAYAFFYYLFFGRQKIGSRRW